MPNHWTEAKLFKFLRLYKRYECLWNPYSPGYENSYAKSEAFSQILSEMNVFGLSINECLNQIKYIRETYKQEQQRLENLAFLGGRSYSNLLWYPLMNSMLAKVIQDEEKLASNRAIGALDLVAAPPRLPFNSGDQRSERDLNKIGYPRGNFSWDENETSTICPYLLNSNFREYMNSYRNSNIPNYSLGMCATNEHISSCPTCGYSSCTCCNCFPINDIDYQIPDNIGRNEILRSEINYRPRTSYNYRNGILEINSAVRIPVSQPSSNCGYGNLIESIMPEESEYNLHSISSDAKPDIQIVEEEEEFSAECSAKSPNCNDEKNKVKAEHRSQEILDRATNNNPNPLNLPINKNESSVKNIDWSSKKSERMRANVHEILRAIDQEIQTNDIQHSARGDPKKLFDIELTKVPLIPQHLNNVNIKAERFSKSNLIGNEANVKIEQTSNMASQNERPVKENIPSKISRVKLQSNEDLIPTATRSRSRNFQTNSKFNSPRSEKTKIREVPNHQRSPRVINDCREKISDAKTIRDLEQESKSILKQNLTKIVIDFIDETLNKPDERLASDANERLILRKVANDLQTLRNERDCFCNGKSTVKDDAQSKQNDGIKSRNKTICWREPIEESLTIVPCKSIKFPSNQTDYKEDVSAGQPMQLNRGRAQCLRMMAGADLDIDNDMKQSNIFNWEDIRCRSRTAITGKCAFIGNRNTRYATTASPSCERHLAIPTDKTQHRNSEDHGKNATRLINNEACQTEQKERILGEGRSVDSEGTKRKNLQSSSTNDIENEECPVVIDELRQAEVSIDLDSLNTDMNGQIMRMGRNSNDGSSEDQMDNSQCQNAHSTLQDITGIENNVTMNISVGTSESKENEIDKVVNEITHVLRKTLDKNGYGIEKEKFFTEKNLITNDNGEINQTLIGNEAAWKTQLRNIIADLIRYKKDGDSIRFKVKTTILPAKDQSNVTAVGATNSTLSITKTRQKLINSNEGLKHCGAEFKDLDSDVFLHKSNKDLQSKRQLLRNHMRKSIRKNKHLIPGCALKNMRHSDKILSDDVSRILSPHNNDPHALWKLLKYLDKFGNELQSIPKKYEKAEEKLLCKQQHRNIDAKFEQNHRPTDPVTANSLEKLPHNLCRDIDVYLCTEISEEDQSLTEKTAVADCNIPNRVDKNVLSISTSTKIKENNLIKSTTDSCIQNTASGTVEDVSDWESFSNSDEKAEIVKHCGPQDKFICQIPKRNFQKNISVEKYGLAKTLNQSNGCYSSPDLLIDVSSAKNYPAAAYASTKTTENPLWYQKHIEKEELFGQPNTYQSCSTEFEGAHEANKDRILNPSESEDGRSLLNTELKIAADNPIESCCTGDKAHAACTPICDVTSRLRLCAILKSQSCTSTANHDIPSDNICCCDEMDKLTNAGAAVSTSPVKPGQKSVMIGDASAELTTASCQTDPLEKDPNFRDSRENASNLNCGEDSNNNIQATCNKAYTKNSAAIDSPIITDDIDHLKSSMIDSATVQSNTENYVSMSLDVAAFEGGSLMLEVKMLQPLFSIELKNGHQDLNKTGVKGNNRDGSLGQETVFESSLKNAVILPHQQSISYINEATSTNFISCGVQNMTDGRTEFIVPKNEEESSSSQTQLGRIHEMESDSKRKIRECSDDTKSSTSLAPHELRKNASTSSEENRNGSDSNQCNTLFGSLTSLDKDPCKIGIDKFSSNEIKSMKLKTLINAVETSLQHIANPIICKKLVDTIKYIKDQEQTRSDSPKEIGPQGLACETSRTAAADKEEMEKQEESQKDISPQTRLFITKGNECQEPCKSVAILVANGSKNIGEMVPNVEIVRDKNKDAAHDSQTKLDSPTSHIFTGREAADQISTIGSHAMLAVAENSYCYSKSCEIATEDKTSPPNDAGVGEIGIRKEAGSESPLSRSVSESQILEVEEPNNTSYENLVTSNNELDKFQGNSRSRSRLNHSSNEISCSVGEVKSNSRRRNLNVTYEDNERSITPRFQNDEYDESSKYYCNGQSTEVDMNAFTSTVASQLRGLSTEAALRSQQRIQTLISNSRLESEKNKKYR